MIRWLPTASILVVIEWICSYQFKSNYLKNRQLFSTFFFSFFESTLNLQCPKREKEVWSVKCFSSYWIQKMCLFNCIAGLVSESSLAVNMLTSLKNSWNLPKSTFILFFLDSEPKWVRKRYFPSDIRF